VAAADVVKAIRENFVLVSAIAAAAGVVLAATFLAAYLAVFDWHLIFFVQYTDIITIGLIAVGISSGSAIFVVNMVQLLSNAFSTEGNKRFMISVIVVVNVLGLAFNIYGAIKGGQGVFHIIGGAVAQVGGVAILWMLWTWYKAAVMPTPIQFGSLAFLLVIISGATGNWLGHSVLEVGQPLEIKIKDATMTDTKLIIELSRHAILLKNRDIYIVPTADITQFHEVAGPGQF